MRKTTNLQNALISYEKQTNVKKYKHGVMVFNKYDGDKLDYELYLTNDIDELFDSLFNDELVDDDLWVSNHYLNTNVQELDINYLLDIYGASGYQFIYFEG